MNSRKFKKTEFKIISYVIILIIIGLVALYSATAGTEFAEFKKQIIWIIIGIPIMLLMTFVDYRIIIRFSAIFYGISIALLVLVLLTSRINGASSWFNIGTFSLQPGEFAKIAVVLFLAKILSEFRKRYKNCNQ